MDLGDLGYLFAIENPTPLKKIRNTYTHRESHTMVEHVRTHLVIPI